MLKSLRTVVEGSSVCGGDKEPAMRWQTHCIAGTGRHNEQHIINESEQTMQKQVGGGREGMVQVRMPNERSKESGDKLSWFNEVWVEREG